MDAARFYVPDLREQARSAEVRFPDDQAHHARTVLRLEEGSLVLLFDGRGAWACAMMTRVGKTAAAKLEEMVKEDPLPRVQLTLATAAPKGERADWLIEQASQLNVSAVQWLACDRGVVKPREGGGKMEKWRRLSIESAKQCGRTHLLEVRDMVSLDQILERPVLPSEILWLDAGAGGIALHEALPRSAAAVRVLALIGPEGGWSPRERTLLEAAGTARRVKRIRLTPTILRIETACVAVAAIVMSA